MHFFDEGEGRQSGLVVEALLSYRSPSSCFQVDRKMVGTASCFPWPSYSLRRKASPGSLYAKLDKCLNNIVLCHYMWWRMSAPASFRCSYVSASKPSLMDLLNSCHGDGGGDRSMAIDPRSPKQQVIQVWASITWIDTSIGCSTILFQGILTVSRIDKGGCSTKTLGPIIAHLNSITNVSRNIQQCIVMGRLVCRFRRPWHYPQTYSLLLARTGSPGESVSSKMAFVMAKSYSGWKPSYDKKNSRLKKILYLLSHSIKIWLALRLHGYISFNVHFSIGSYYQLVFPFIMVFRKQQLIDINYSLE